MSGRHWLQPVLLAAVVVAAVVIGGVVATREDDASSSVARTPATTTHPVASTPAMTPTALAPNVTGSIADIVARVGDSAVVIEGPNSAGSGIVIDRDGHILTNYHVVQGQPSLKVTLADGSASTATVLGIDPDTDLAVIQATFPADDLTPATLGDSDQMRAGDPVFAIGDPFSYPYTVSSGIISATGRTTQSSFTGRSIHDVLQIDAAVNPGNSGGPLFNLAGEVIGINTSIENPDGRFFVGLGFAIPSNTALRFLPDLIAGQTIKHPQLGVSVLPLDQVIAPTLGVTVARGLYVTSVQPGSAAARAGLVPGQLTRTGQTGAGGDVILSIDGKQTLTFLDLVRAIDMVDVGSTVTIVIERAGARQTVSATLQPWDLQSN